MAYVKNYATPPGWQTGAGGGTPITEATLDHIETQYDEAAIDLAAHVINQAAGDGRHRWTANRLLNGQGAAAPVEIVIPDTATKQFFTPFEQGTAVGQQGDFPVFVLTNPADSAYACFYLPDDFTTLVEVVVVGIKITNGNIDWTVTTDAGADGEAYTTHSDTDTANGVVMLTTLIYEIDCSLAFTNMTAGDYVGLLFTLDAITAGNFRVIGVMLKYT